MKTDSPEERPNKISPIRVEFPIEQEIQWNNTLMMPSPHKMSREPFKKSPNTKRAKGGNSPSNIFLSQVVGASGGQNGNKMNTGANSLDISSIALIEEDHSQSDLDLSIANKLAGLKFKKREMIEVVNTSFDGQPLNLLESSGLKNKQVNRSEVEEKQNLSGDGNGRARKVVAVFKEVSSFDDSFQSGKRPFSGSGKANLSNLNQKAVGDLKNYKDGQKNIEVSDGLNMHKSRKKQPQRIYSKDKKSHKAAVKEIESKNKMIKFTPSTPTLSEATPSVSNKSQNGFPDDKIIENKNTDKRINSNLEVESLLDKKLKNKRTRRNNRRNSKSITYTSKSQKRSKSKKPAQNLRIVEDNFSKTVNIGEALNKHPIGSDIDNIDAGVEDEDEVTSQITIEKPLSGKPQPINIPQKPASIMSPSKKPLRRNKMVTPPKRMLVLKQGLSSVINDPKKEKNEEFVKKQSPKKVEGQFQISSRSKNETNIMKPQIIDEQKLKNEEKAERIMFEYESALDRVSEVTEAREQSLDTAPNLYNSVDIQSPITNNISLNNNTTMMSKESLNEALEGENDELIWLTKKQEKFISNLSNQVKVLSNNESELITSLALQSSRIVDLEKMIEEFKEDGNKQHNYVKALEFENGQLRREMVQLNKDLSFLGEENQQEVQERNREINNLTQKYLYQREISKTKEDENLKLLDRVQQLEKQLETVESSKFENNHKIQSKKGKNRDKSRNSLRQSTSSSSIRYVPQKSKTSKSKNTRQKRKLKFKALDPMSYEYSVNEHYQKKYLNPSSLPKEISKVENRFGRIITNYSDGSKKTDIPNQATRYVILYLLILHYKNTVVFKYKYLTN